jgi:hypothetical protein
LTQKLYNLEKANTDRELAINIEKYNLFHMEVFNRLDNSDIEFQKFNHLIMEDFSFVIQENKKTTHETFNINMNYGIVNSAGIETKNTLDNNILRICEKDQTAYLPYKYANVEKIFNSKRRNKGKYKTIKDVIKNIYTVPFSAFRFPIISRFRETFNLIMREKKDLKDAVFTGVEVMSYHDLNPIIIRACQSVKEFNIYLDCLAENELDQFPFFEIKFEVAPALQKRSKNEEFFVAE